MFEGIIEKVLTVLDGMPEGTIGTVLASLGSGGLLWKYMEHHFKRRDIQFERLGEAIKAVHPVFVEYIRLSKELCDAASCYELTLDRCIRAYDEKVQKLVDLKGKLSDLSAEYMHCFDNKTVAEIEKVNSLISDALKQLGYEFDAVEQFREDGDEVLRIMKAGTTKYCEMYTREIDPILARVEKRIRKN